MSFRRVAPDREPTLERNRNKVTTPACKNLKVARRKRAFARHAPPRAGYLALLSLGGAKTWMAGTGAAADLGDLRSPPGTRLKALAGDRKGQHSIRINDQFRVCFVWTVHGPAEVEIVDYH